MTQGAKTELERKGYTKQEVEEAVGLAQARMFSVVGASINSEVFLNEGAIYLTLLEKLLPVVAAEYRERWLTSKKM